MSGVTIQRRMDKRETPFLSQVHKRKKERTTRCNNHPSQGRETEYERENMREREREYEREGRGTEYERERRESFGTTGLLHILTVVFKLWPLAIQGKREREKLRVCTRLRKEIPFSFSKLKSTKGTNNNSA